MLGMRGDEEEQPARSNAGGAVSVGDSKQRMW